MNNHIKLIAKPNSYYDAGTEVYNYDGNRFTKDDWNEWVKSGIACVRGYVKGTLDGDTSLIEEFEVEYGVGPKSINNKEI
jgi:hypothetical protein